LNVGALLSLNARVAIDAVLANRLRSSLTALGVTIGIASVVLVTALGQAAQYEIGRSIEALGAKMVVVWPAAQAGHSRRGRLTQRDAEVILRNTQGAIAVAPQVRTTVQVAAAGNYANTTVTGIEPGYLQVTKTSLAGGRTVGADPRVAVPSCPHPRGSAGSLHPATTPRRRGSAPGDAVGCPSVRIREFGTARAIPGG